MTRRRWFLGVLILTLALASVSWAGNFDDVRDARQRLEDAETRVRDLANSISAAQSAVNTAIAQANSDGSAIASAQQQVIASSSALNAMNAQIVANQDVARSATDVAAQARADAAAAKEDLDSDSAALQKYQADAKTAFECSPAFKQVSDELTNASNAYQSTYNDTYVWLRGTLEYVELYDNLDDLQSQIDALRNERFTDPSVTATTSHAWMDAMNTFNKFRDDYMSQDLDVKAARERLNAAQNNRKALVDRFNRDLSLDSQVKQLTDAIATDQSDLATASATANDADAKLAAANQAIAQLQANITIEQANLDAAQQQVAASAGAANWSSNDVTVAQNELTRLCGLQGVAQRDYQSAWDDFHRKSDLADAHHDRRNHREADRREGEHHDRDAQLASDHQRPDDRINRENVRQFVGPVAPRPEAPSRQTTTKTSPNDVKLIPKPTTPVTPVPQPIGPQPKPRVVDRPVAKDSPKPTTPTTPTRPPPKHDDGKGDKPKPAQQHQPTPTPRPQEQPKQEQPRQEQPKHQDPPKREDPPKHQDPPKQSDPPRQAPANNQPDQSHHDDAAKSQPAPQPSQDNSQGKSHGK